MNTVLITGISRGIGKALAEKFLHEGYFIIGTSTNGIAELQHENLKVFALDLSKPESIKECVSQIVEINKKIDILINNAGTWSGAEGDPVVHMDYLRKTLEINLIGTIDFTEQIIPVLHENAHIINVSSRAGSIERSYHANYPDYKISKAAINMYTKVLSIRFGEKFTASSVHPGWVKTDMGGMEADLEPQEAAEDIYKLAISRPETGQFWYKGEKFPW